MPPSTNIFEGDLFWGEPSKIYTTHKKMSIVDELLLTQQELKECNTRITDAISTYDATVNTTTKSQREALELKKQILNKKKFIISQELEMVELEQTLLNHPYNRSGVQLEKDLRAMEEAKMALTDEIIKSLTLEKKAKELKSALYPDTVVVDQVRKLQMVDHPAYNLELLAPGSPSW